MKVQVVSTCSTTKARSVIVDPVTQAESEDTVGFVFESRTMPAMPCRLLGT